ncbi:MAG: hypothetical protein WEE69_01925 [Acidimicrobiia bacterium]
MQQLTETVKQRVRDGASLAVGVGVLGYQAARTGAEEAQNRVSASVKDARGAAEQGARRAWEQIEVLGTEVLERVEPVIARVSDRVEPLIGDLAVRVEPYVDRIQARAQALARRPVTESKTETPTSVDA